MTDKNVAEIQTISELALILTISVFSVVLIVLDILLSWEKWMIPLVLAAMLGCVATYVLGLFSFKAACYIYGIILIVEVFYYTVKAKTVNAKAKKKTTIKKAKAFTVAKAQGKVTFKKASGNKKITVGAAGKVTVKKGLKKGKTYKVKVKVTAAGNANYKALTKTVTLKVKVK